MFGIYRNIYGEACNYNITCVYEKLLSFAAVFLSKSSISQAIHSASTSGGPGTATSATRQILCAAGDQVTYNQRGRMLRRSSRAAPAAQRSSDPSIHGDLPACLASHPSMVICRAACLPCSRTNIAACWRRSVDIWPGGGGGGGGRGATTIRTQCKYYCS